MMPVSSARQAARARQAVNRAHDELDARGVTITLLHHAQVNPLSTPFWNRMGYRPLWTGLEARPASALR